jgi:hypothetical protein
MKTYTSEEIFEAKKEVVRAQIERFHEFYYSYFQREETLKMVEFFFERVYNLEGKQEWIDIAYNSFEKVKTMMKESTRESMEQLMELHAITDKLDTEMALLILRKGWKENDKLSRSEYDLYFRELGYAEERTTQLKYVLKNLIQFYELAHRPINAVIMKPARFMSKVLGVYPLFATVEEGYYACLTVSKEIFDSFYKEVEKKEWEYLKQAFPEFNFEQRIQESKVGK